VNFDANRLRIAVVTEDTRPVARDLTEAFRASHFLDVRTDLHRRPALAALTRGEVRGVAIIPEDFGASAARGAPLIQVLTDGSEPNIASML
jgi:ABC-2 type transport system permease protein